MMKRLKNIFLLAGYSFFDPFTSNESRSVTEKFYGLSIINKDLEGTKILCRNVGSVPVPTAPFKATSPYLMKTSAEYVDGFLKKLKGGNDE